MIVPFIPPPAASFAPLRRGVLQKCGQPLDRLRVDDRPQHYIGLGRITHRELGSLGGQLADESVRDLFVEHEALGGHADLALIHEGAESGGIDGGVEIGVVQHDQRRGKRRHRPLMHAAEAIHRELRHPDEGGMNMIMSHVTVILVHAWRLAGFHLPQPEVNRSGSASFQRFLHAVALHFREDWPIARYASQLGVSERRLHGAVTKASGRSPVQLLHLRILEGAAGTIGLADRADRLWARFS
jgi:AraC-like DNA-binding protein